MGVFGSVAAQARAAGWMLDRPGLIPPSCCAAFAGVAMAVAIHSAATAQTVTAPATAAQCVEDSARGQFTCGAGSAATGNTATAVGGSATAPGDASSAFGFGSRAVGPSSSA